MKPLLMVFVSLSILLALTTIISTAHAGLHTGVGLGYWDFSAGHDSATNWDFGPGNTMLFGENALAYVLLSNPPARITLLPPEITYEGLTEAPADPTVYVSGMTFVPQRVWVVKTREGHYAKVRFLPDPSDAFEYTYQDDGTRLFAAPVATSVSTWGRIKCLYR